MGRNADGSSGNLLTSKKRESASTTRNSLSSLPLWERVIFPASGFQMAHREAATATRHEGAPISRRETSSQLSFCASCLLWNDRRFHSRRGRRTRTEESASGLHIFSPYRPGAYRFFRAGTTRQAMHGPRGIHLLPSEAGFFLPDSSNSFLLPLVVMCSGYVAISSNFERATSDASEEVLFARKERVS